MRIPCGAIALLLTCLVPGINSAGETNELDSDRARESYSVGFEAISRLQRQGREPDLAALLRGALDALSGTPKLDSVDMQSVLKNLQPQRPGHGVRDELSPIRRGQEFLASNTDRPGVTTLPSGLQYKVIRMGSGDRPRQSDTVVVHYRGSRVDGSEIDSSWSADRPVVYRVDEVMPGWTEALQRMPEGSEWELYIPPRLAFGKRGPLENQTLVYRINLLAVIREPTAAAGRSQPATATPAP